VGFVALQVGEMTGRKWRKSPHLDLYYGTQDNQIKGSTMTAPHGMDRRVAKAIPAGRLCESRDGGWPGDGSSAGLPAF